jgi:hypothetical protein
MGIAPQAARLVSEVLPTPLCSSRAGVKLHSPLGFEDVRSRATECEGENHRWQLTDLTPDSPLRKGRVHGVAASEQRAL